MGRFLTVDDFILAFGEDEVAQISGTDNWNTAEGSQIDRARVEREIAFCDEVIAGYVIARHPWLSDLSVEDVPNLLKGFAADILRYRLRDRHGMQGQVSDTVETRYKSAMQALLNIQSGKLDLIQDKKDGADLIAAELHDGITDLVRHSGPVPETDKLLEGY